MTVATALRRSVPVVSTWTPASLSPYLWLDASQESYNDGDAVGTWTNRGTGANNATSSGSNRPTFKTGIINGQPVLRFTAASSHYMTVASYNPASATAGQMSMWAVMTASAGADYVVGELSANFNSADAFLFLRNSDNTVFLADHKNGSNYSGFQTTGTVTTSAGAFVGTLDRTLSTNEVTGYLNSTTSAGTRWVNANTSGDMSTNTLYLGSRGGSSLFLNGDIAEMGFVKSVLSSSDRSLLMSYLGTKYGITIS